MPPEWFDTTRAPPTAGMLSTFRTSARCHSLIAGATLSTTCLQNAGSHLAVSRSLAATSFMFSPIFVSPACDEDYPLRTLYIHRGYVNLQIGECHYHFMWHTAHLARSGEGKHGRESSG